MMRLLALAISGCGAMSPVDQAGERPTYNGLKAEVATNRERWQASQPAEYSYRLDWSCFCGFPSNRIAVAAGVVTKAERPQYEEDRTDPTWVEVPLENDDVLSIQELFDKVVEWADQRPEHLKVEYEPTLHYPTHAFVDHSEGVADDETAVYVREFVVKDE